MVKLYGIPNCSTVKKAREWLLQNGVEYEFVDFKKTAPDAALIGGWIAQAGLEVLVNKRGTTWRKLDEAAQAAAADAEQAAVMMSAHSSVIKRPVLDVGGKIYVGFSPEFYQEVFAS